MPNLFNQKFVEFAVSCGEGTLLDYGVAAMPDGAAPHLEFHENADGERFTLIVGPCDRLCPTGA